MNDPMSSPTRNIIKPDTKLYERGHTFLSSTHYTKHHIKRNKTIRNDKNDKNRCVCLFRAQPEGVWGGGRGERPGRGPGGGAGEWAGGWGRGGGRGGDPTWWPCTRSTYQSIHRYKSGWHPSSTKPHKNRLPVGLEAGSHIFLSFSHYYAKAIAPEFLRFFT